MLGPPLTFMNGASTIAGTARFWENDAALRSPACRPLKLALWWLIRRVHSLTSHLPCLSTLVLPQPIPAVSDNLSPLVPTKPLLNPHKSLAFTRYTGLKKGAPVVKFCLLIS